MGWADRTTGQVRQGGAMIPLPGRQACMPRKGRLPPNQHNSDPLAGTRLGAQDKRKFPSRRDAVPWSVSLALIDTVMLGAMVSSVIWRAR